MEEVIPQSEPNPEGSSSSSVSTPEPDGEILLQGAVKRQKRKGGRKPNSLLERILLEKGTTPHSWRRIDVQAELRLKSGSPNMLSAKPAGQTISQNSPLSRADSNRQSVNRHKVGETPKLDHSNISQAHREDAHTMSSPQLHPTPTSHISSPSTAKSPGFNLQGGISIPGAGIQTQQQKDTPQLHQLLPPPILPASSSYSSNGNGSNGQHFISATSPNPATPTIAALPNVSSDNGAS
ncbi:predicted protein [Histoplasma mississippiense (nom. inval.)]|uniref:predicted protein n=1 Tax=Ajellomyces capsulatus (strain NAm1 / WU24) TaxID=2059318 RepID=UPI000157BA19|nr:predicted protein [Histoplasma mississippiense (nom. inval.)]EDN04051.1 predicted protein [Histoplasma mississippiense (nom. inval.)]